MSITSVVRMVLVAVFIATAISGPAQVKKNNRGRWRGLPVDRVIAMGHDKWVTYYLSSIPEERQSRADWGRADGLFQEAIRERNKRLYKRLPKATAVRIGRLDDQLRIVDRSCYEIGYQHVGGHAILADQDSEEAGMTEYRLLQNALSKPKRTADAATLRKLEGEADREFEALESGEQHHEGSGGDDNDYINRTGGYVTVGEHIAKIRDALKRIRGLVNGRDLSELRIVYGFIKTTLGG